MKVKTHCLYRFNGFQLDVDERLLKKGDCNISLTPKAFDTLVVLLENKGKVVEKETLLNRVWADTFVEEATLAQNISTLRKVLGTYLDDRQLIETVPRRGYRFIGEVNEVVDTGEIILLDKHDRSDFDNSHEFIGISDIDDSEPPREKFVPESQISNSVASVSGNYSRFLFIGLLLIVILFISFGLVSYFRSSKDDLASSTSIKSVAVLPFQTIGEQSDQEKSGLGIADAIIIRLSKLQKIPVRSTNSIFRYVDQPAADSLEAGRALGVDAILEGTIQRDGGRVRVTVQLTNVADGKPLWAEKFDEKDSDVFDLQDSISTKVVQSMALKLTPEQQKLLEEHLTDSPEAFEKYQVGVYLWNTRTQENLNKAKDLFEKATEIDPKFAKAYGMLADTYYLLGYYGYSSRQDFFEKATVNANKALALDDSIAEAYMALAGANTRTNNLSNSLKYLEEAVKRAPYNSSAHVRYSWLLLRLGQPEQALAEMKLAKEYDPISPVSNGALCNMLVYRENFAEAIKVCQKAVDISPKSAETRLFMANALFFNGNTDEAIAQAKLDAEQGEHKDISLATLGFFYAKLGRNAEAEETIAKLKPAAENQPVLYTYFAAILYALNKKEEAITQFKTAYDKKAISMLTLSNDPIWKEMRTDPRYIEIMAE